MFNPAFPPTFNSLNSLIFAELPDYCPKYYLGKKGYELLSSQALTQSIQANLSELGIPRNQSDLDLHLWFFLLLAKEENSAAIAIAEQMGQALGVILQTLHEGTEVNRLANPSKGAAYWDYWSTVNQVYIGGGLCSGKAGKIIASEAQKLCPDIRLIAAEHPRYLPLMGAARYVPTGQSALVLDFGGTLVKRAIAHYQDDTLSHLELLETLSFSAQANSAQAIFDSFVNILAKSYQNLDSDLIPVSVAAYVDAAGQPYLNQHGIYMQMASLSNNLPELLSKTVSERVGREIQIKLLHDGTAAASFYSPLENAVVITLGTAIGSGYPVPRPNLRLLNPHKLRVNNP